MVHEQIATADGGEHVDAVALLALQARLGHRRPRRVAQVAEARQADDLPQVGEVEQPLDHVDLALLDLQRLGQLSAQRGAHRAVDLQAHDLAEAAAAQLGLDGAQQVVGLVGDVEVSVARDAEEAVVDDLHAGEERVEVGGDELLERDERRAVADRDEARQHLLGHLHAREGRHLRLRVADEHRQRKRQVGDVRERSPEADGKRGQDREDLAPEALVERGVLGLGDIVHRDDRDPVLGQRGAHGALRAARLALVELDNALAQLVDDPRRRAPVGTGIAEARVDLVVQAGDADREELVEVRGEDGQELRPLEQRRVLLLCQLEHARVELDPRHLAVVVQARIVQIGRRQRRLGLRQRDGADGLLLSHRARPARLRGLAAPRRYRPVKALLQALLQAPDAR